MNSKTNNDVKWYDKRLMIPSLIIFLILSGLFYSLAMRHKPPEGHVFPRESVIRGIYKCCEAGGRSSASWVGNVQVNCKGFGYRSAVRYPDCGLKEQLNGHPVEVTKALLPSSEGVNPIVVRIVSHDQIYYEVNDQRIRERWIFESTSDSAGLAFILTLIPHFILSIYFIYFHKPAH